jgi:hypothetical protein
VVSPRPPAVLAAALPISIARRMINHTIAEVAPNHPAILG